MVEEFSGAALRFPTAVSLSGSPFSMCGNMGIKFFYINNVRAGDNSAEAQKGFIFNPSFCVTFACSPCVLHRFYCMWVLQLLFNLKDFDRSSVFDWVAAHWAEMLGMFFCGTCNLI